MGKWILKGSRIHGHGIPSELINAVVKADVPPTRNGWKPTGKYPAVFVSPRDRKGQICWIYGGIWEEYTDKYDKGIEDGIDNENQKV